MDAVVAAGCGPGERGVWKGDEKNFTPGVVVDNAKRRQSSTE